MKTQTSFTLGIALILCTTVACTPADRGVGAATSTVPLVATTTLAVSSSPLPQQPSSTPIVAATVAATPRPSPTPMPSLALSAQEATPETPPLRSGIIDVIIPYWIGPEGSEPSDPPTCVTEIPFTVRVEEMRQLVSGTSPIACHFVSEGLPYTINVEFALEATLEGEILPATTDFPDGWLDAQIWVEGSIQQVWENFPGGASPCTASSPCTAPGSQHFPLPFPLKEGAELSPSWTFVLHLDR